MASEAVTEGASLPDGIEVDETSAYFGITSSSDVLHELRALDRHSALVRFMEVTADLHLADGEFDFESASERMNCEGGEIYFLVAGHLGLMEITDPLRLYLGMEDSLGNPGIDSGLDPAEMGYLGTLVDAMSLLRAFAIAHITGGGDMVRTYARGLEAFLSNPDAYKDNLLEVAQEMAVSVASAQSGTTPAPLSSLVATGTISLPTSPAPQPSPGVVGVAEMPQSSAQSVPLPGAELSQAEPTASHAWPTSSTPAAPSVPLPSSAESEPAPEVVEVHADSLTERQTKAVAMDAFSGAFGSELEPEPHPIAGVEGVEAETEAEAEAEVEIDALGDAFATAISTDAVPEPEPLPLSEPEVEPEPQPQAELDDEPDGEPEPEAPVEIEIKIEEEEEDADLIEHEQRFIAADTDGDGKLSAEEITEAMKGDRVAAEALLEAADTDGDGEVSMSEYLEHAEKAKDAKQGEQEGPVLPRPITPIRRPVGGGARPQNIHSHPGGSTMGQPTGIEPTIRSGVHCRGCGIGIDPHWRHCPICGSRK